MATVRVDVFPADKAPATEAAERLRDLIGDRTHAWDVAISTPPNATYWLVEVSGEWKGQELLWRLIFDGEWQTAKAVVEQFRLSLRPYPA